MNAVSKCQEEDVLKDCHGFLSCEALLEDDNIEAKSEEEEATKEPTEVEEESSLFAPREVKRGASKSPSSAQEEAYCVSGNNYS